MKLAVIPPVSKLSYIQNRDVHLLLPQLIENFPDYEKFYTYMPKRTRVTRSSSKSKYYILDNGAAEGYEYTGTRLHDLAERYHADEIVIPDEMGHGRLSEEKMRKFKRLPGKRYMYVLHGNSIMELVERVQAIKDDETITSIGLPRILFSSIGQATELVGATLRCTIASMIVKTVKRPLDIHLLGASPLWYSEARFAAASPYIRSMDTSLPYVLASHGQLLTDETRPGLKRKAHFFRWVPNDDEQSMAHWNVETMDGWIRAGHRINPEASGS